MSGFTKPNQTNEFETKARQLLEQGYTTVPVLSLKECREAMDAIDNYVQNAPEIHPDSKGSVEVLVLGSFACIGLPSTFHDDRFRAMRDRYYVAMQPIMVELARLAGLKRPTVEMLMDRVMRRESGQASGLPKDSWHKDIYHTDYKKVDLARERWVGVFGGGINLNTIPHAWSVVPRSHTYDPKVFTNTQTGWSKVEGGAMLQGKRVVCPAGHAFVLNQNITHEVVGDFPKTKYRLFVGMSLRDGATRPLFDVGEVMDKGGTPPTPSGENPPMYSKQHFASFMTKGFSPLKGSAKKQSLVEWSEQFIPAMKETITRQSGEFAGQQFSVVKRHPPSLSEMGIPFTPYSECEREQYYPARI